MNQHDMLQLAEAIEMLSDKQLCMVRHCPIEDLVQARGIELKQTS